jgi:hypothetical protein
MDAGSRVLTERMSRDEQRATDARLQDWRDRAARHRLNPFVGPVPLTFMGSPTKRGSPVACV